MGLRMNHWPRLTWIAAISLGGALGCSQAPAKVDVKELERQQEETMKQVREQERLEREKAKATGKTGPH